MREIVFFTSKEDSFSKKLYTEMIKECITPLIIKKKEIFQDMLRIEKGLIYH